MRKRITNERLVCNFCSQTNEKTGMYKGILNAYICNDCVKILLIEYIKTHTEGMMFYPNGKK